jgi:hypothetical protein
MLRPMHPQAGRQALVYELAFRRSIGILLRGSAADAIVQEDRGIFVVPGCCRGYQQGAIA